MWVNVNEQHNEGLKAKLLYFYSQNPNTVVTSGLNRLCFCLWFAWLSRGHMTGITVPLCGKGQSDTSLWSLLSVIEIVGHIVHKCIVQNKHHTGPYVIKQLTTGTAMAFFCKNIYLPNPPCPHPTSWPGKPDK